MLKLPHIASLGFIRVIERRYHAISVRIGVLKLVGSLVVIASLFLI